MLLTTKSSKKRCSFIQQRMLKISYRKQMWRKLQGGPMRTVMNMCIACPGRTKVHSHTHTHTRRKVHAGECMNMWMLISDFPECGRWVWGVRVGFSSDCGMLLISGLSDMSSRVSLPDGLLPLTLWSQAWSTLPLGNGARQSVHIQLTYCEEYHSLVWWKQAGLLEQGRWQSGYWLSSSVAVRS